MFALLLAFVAGAGAMYAVSEPEKQELRKTATDLEQHAQEQEDRIRAEKDAHRRLALQNFRTLLKYYVERLQRLAEGEEVVSVEKRLRLHVIVLHLQQLHAAGGDPITMSASDQRYCRFLSSIMDDAAGDPDDAEAAWFESYGITCHPEASRTFLLDTFLRQKRRIDSELVRLRKTVKDAEVGTRNARTRASVEGGVEFNRLAAVHEQRGSDAESKIAGLETLDQDIKRNLVILHRICRPQEELDERDKTARDILERLSGLHGASLQTLVGAERDFLNAYRDLYAFQVSSALEQEHRIRVV